jgi:hypothetical protein
MSFTTSDRAPKGLPRLTTVIGSLALAQPAAWSPWFRPHRFLRTASAERRGR